GLRGGVEPAEEVLGIPPFDDGVLVIGTAAALLAFGFVILGARQLLAQHRRDEGQGRFRGVEQEVRRPGGWLELQQPANDRFDHGVVTYLRRRERLNLGDGGGDGRIWLFVIIVVTADGVGGAFLALPHFDQRV